MPVLPVVARNCVRFSLQFAKMNGGILCQVSFLLYVCKKLWMNTLFQKTEVKVSNSHGRSSEYFALWCCRIVGSLEQSLQWISRNRKWSKVPQFLTYHNLMAQIGYIYISSTTTTTLTSILSTEKSAKPVFFKEIPFMEYWETELHENWWRFCDIKHYCNTSSK